MSDRPTPAAAYAWCFSHGALHAFPTGQQPWCTASWARLEGINETEALAAKEAKYGTAQFIHELPRSRQMELIDLAP